MNYDQPAIDAFPVSSMWRERFFGESFLLLSLDDDRAGHPRLSIVRQYELASISRSSFYCDHNDAGRGVGTKNYLIAASITLATTSNLGDQPKGGTSQASCRPAHDQGTRLMIIPTEVPVFYDCEASCLGGLPIEIGWAFVDTATGEVQSESHLVKPPTTWDMRSVWDPDAQKLHRISREQLVAQGRPPFEIARRMNQVLAGRELFSDAPGDDERWLGIIFDEAGLEPTFTVRRTHAEVLIAQLVVRLGWDSIRYQAAKIDADRVSPRTHRAEADARHLAMLWRIISVTTATRP